MKTIDATWEKRNLGVSCVEITVNKYDTIEMLQDVLKTVDSDYTVLKIPAQESSLLFHLPTMGFVFIEDMISVKSNLAIPLLNRVQQQIIQDVRIEEMDCLAFEGLLEQTRKGLFNSDRVSIDPYFTAEQAANRFCEWIKDERSRGTLFYQYIYKGEPIGFVSLRDCGNGCFDSVLGGLYSAYQRSAIGTALNYLNFKVVASRGGTQILTNVSSNNLVQIRSLLACGYQITQIMHIFVRHKTDRNEE